jgi:hypothetical protein
MLVARIIEGHSREHRKGHGDETAHAARDGEHDKDDAVVVLRHEGTSMRRCRARSSARLRAKRAAKRGPTRKRQFSPFLQRLTRRDLPLTERNFALCNHLCRCVRDVIEIIGFIPYLVRISQSYAQQALTAWFKRDDLPRDVNTTLMGPPRSWPQNNPDTGLTASAARITSGARATISAAH